MSIICLRPRSGLPHRYGVAMSNYEALLRPLAPLSLGYSNHSTTSTAAQASERKSPEMQDFSLKTKKMEDFCKLEKQGNLFILTLLGNDEHRLNPTVVDSIRAALQQVRDQATGSSALITTAEGKFFSNGYDLKWVGANAGRGKIVSRKLRELVSELIHLPMPTIAAVTGHASAAGLVLAMAHDYLLMRKDRGVLYMSELDIGFKVPLCFVTLIKSKANSPTAWREIILKATKVTADMGMQWGIVDSAHEGAEATVEAAVKLGEDLMRRNWKGQVYADNRTALLAEVLSALGIDETVGDYGSAITVSKL